MSITLTPQNYVVFKPKGVAKVSPQNFILLTPEHDPPQSITVDTLRNVKKITPWRYENYGTADKLLEQDENYKRYYYDPVTYTTTTDVSKFESAFSCQSYALSPFDIPTTDTELWIKLDVYGNASWSVYERNMGAEYGISVSSNGYISVEGISDDVQTSTKVITGELQTVLIHFVSNENDGQVEVWVDGTQVINYTGAFYGDELDCICFYGGEDWDTDEPVKFSNVIISNVEIGLDEDATDTRPKQVSISIDTQRKVSATQIISVDTLRAVGIIYVITTVDTYRNVVNANSLELDTYRNICHLNALEVDTHRIVNNDNYIQVEFDTLRNRVKSETINADTNRRFPYIFNYVDTRQSQLQEQTQKQSLTVRALNNEDIAENYRDAHVKSITIGLNEMSISDNIQFETVDNLLEINDPVQGQFLTFPFNCMVEETTQKGLTQTINCMYDIDSLFYSQLNFLFSDYDDINVSTYLHLLTKALGLTLDMKCDDFILDQNYTKSGMTYKDLVSSLFGWTSRLPHRQINVFIRGKTLHVIQRGSETDEIDITNWPHTLPTIHKQIVRSLWNSTQNGGTENQAHNEEDLEPLPFTGTISFGELSYSYNDGYLVYSTNEQGYTEYYYEPILDVNDLYLKSKRTHNKDGSTSEVHYEYAVTDNELYLVREEEHTTEPIEGAEDHDWRDWTDWSNEDGTTRVTYHIPVGVGWFATEVFVDDKLEGTGLSQGRPGNKASQFMIDRSNLALGSHWFNKHDDDEEEEEWPYTTLVDTEFPVKGDEYLRQLTLAIEWLNRKIREEVTVDIVSKVVDGVPEIQHIVDFTERVVFEGNVYYLVSNKISFTSREFRQSLQLVRWY